MFHVCLGVTHERECFQEVAEGLSYKGVKLFLFCLKHYFQTQVMIKVHPQRLLNDRKSFNFDIGLIKLDRKVFFGPDIGPICLKVLSKMIL